MTNQNDTSQRPLSILVVDDEKSLRTSIELNLQHHGYFCRGAANTQEAFTLLDQNCFDIVLCDQRLPGSDGISFIKQCRERNPDLAVILITGFGSSELALEAMRAGAYDYLSKPFSIEELILTLRKVEERERLRSENAALKNALGQKHSFCNIIARSQALLKIFEIIKRVAAFNTTVLIKGESGTGKELLARAIHYNSPRRMKPFVAINCGAIPENLMESELFGHVKGAFTDAARDKVGLLEEANHGTVFLDEIGEMPPHLQVKLLRVLQQRQIQRVGDEKLRDIDVRIIAATLRDLDQDVATGRFREDLLYRLNVVSIEIPPLRERPEDIPVLIEHFLRKHNKRLGLNIRRIEPDAMQCLLNYHWRGNVRELENCVERALVLTEGASITKKSLPEAVRKAATPPLTQAISSLPKIDEDNLSIKQRVKALEQELIIRALEKTNGNRTHAAKILEISHRTLLYKLKEYGLDK